jgi:hypothetical protein
MDRVRTAFQPIHQQRPPFRTLHNYPPLDPVNAWTRALNFSTTPQPQRPPQPTSAQFHYRSDPRLAHEVNCTCSLSSNLPTNNSSQPTARKFDHCEAGMSSPAQCISAPTPPPETAHECHSDSSTWVVQ